jgi:hypothetical protein
MAGCGNSPEWLICIKAIGGSGYNLKCVEITCILESGVDVK